MYRMYSTSMYRMYSTIPVDEGSHGDTRIKQGFGEVDEGSHGDTRIKQGFGSRARGQRVLNLLAYTHKLRPSISTDVNIKG